MAWSRLVALHSASKITLSACLPALTVIGDDVRRINLLCESVKSQEDGHELHFDIIITQTMINLTSRFYDQSSYTIYTKGNN